MRVVPSIVVFIVNFNWINYTRPGVSSLSETWINKFYYQRIFNEKSALRQENIKFIHDIYENLFGSEQFISGFQDCHLKQWISARGVTWWDSWYMKRKKLQKRDEWRKYADNSGYTVHPVPGLG